MTPEERVSRALFEGEAMEIMVQTDGWAVIKDWMESERRRYLSALSSQSFSTLAQVAELQSALRTLGSIEATIQERISRKAGALLAIANTDPQED